MSEPQDGSRRESNGDEENPDETPAQGPNLVLLYSLIGLALVAAIVFAMMIVLPFYQRR